jgi:hypothetical protein
MLSLKKIPILLSLLIVASCATSPDKKHRIENVNNLRPCSALDEAKSDHNGTTGKTWQWHNCWGTYIFEDVSNLQSIARGDIAVKRLSDPNFGYQVQEGEWKNGKLNGRGLLIEFNGRRYEGIFENGLLEGVGSVTNPYHIWGILDSAWTYRGEFKAMNPHGFGILNLSSGGKYIGQLLKAKYDGYGKYIFEKNNENKVYEGQWKSSKRHGFGKGVKSNGEQYIGNWFDDKYEGYGIFLTAEGQKLEGRFSGGGFVKEEKVSFSFSEFSEWADTSDNLHASESFFVENKSKIKNLFSENRKSKNFIVDVNHSKPTADGEFFIYIKSNGETASLKINGEEIGGSSDGDYQIKRYARPGQSAELTVIAKDASGNTYTKTITVNRPLAASSPKFAALNPVQVKKQPERDAVAIIIGIADYKNFPRADFANDDARIFYDYVVRALGVKPENIKLLVDGDADQAEIYRAFRAWLPIKVRASTDVYVYYSGHGLPSANGQELYLLPPRADRDFIDKTAISQAEINAAIQAAKPKSVTVFLDSCYSGQARSGETLIASARPVALKTAKQLFPDNFTVITASQSDQISSSSPDLKHGIFSYYLMRGMEGDADSNRDGRITAGEMHAYLSEQVSRQAGMMNRKQEPQLLGDANRVLVGW